MWRYGLVLAVVAAALLGRAPAAHGGATTVPSYRTGSCDDGAACTWDCSLSDNENPFCADNSVCTQRVAESFTAHVVVRADDAPCGSNGGAVVEVGLRGRKADGTKFSIPSRTIDLCGVNNECGGCDGGICSCDPGCLTCDSECLCPSPPTDVCSGVQPGSCPLASIFHCEKASANFGQDELCDVAPNGERRFCEEDLVTDVATRFASWLVGGNQPLPPTVFGDLTAHFPSAADVPFADPNFFPTVLDFIDHSGEGEPGDEQPSVAHYCVKFDFLTTAKPKPIPAAVQNAQIDGGSLVVVGDCQCPRTLNSLCSVFGGGLLLVSEETPGREKLVAKWLEGPALSGGALGNPLGSGGTDYDLCMYNDNGALVAQYTVARAGDTCGTGPCWKSVGGAPGSPEHKGYRYKDKDVTADGTLRLLFKGGAAGQSKAILKGKNNAAKAQASLPLGTAAALAGSTTVTIQLVPSDASTCLSATLVPVQDTGSRYKAK